MVHQNVSTLLILLSCLTVPIQWSITVGRKLAEPNELRDLNIFYVNIPPYKIWGFNIITNSPSWVTTCISAELVAIAWWQLMAFVFERVCRFSILAYEFCDLLAHSLGVLVIPLYESAPSLLLQPLCFKRSIHLSKLLGQEGTLIPHIDHPWVLWLYGAALEDVIALIRLKKLLIPLLNPIREIRQTIIYKHISLILNKRFSQIIIRPIKNLNTQMDDIPIIIDIIFFEYIPIYL